MNFYLAETAVELLFWRKTPASVKRGLQTAHLKSNEILSTFDH